MVKDVMQIEKTQFCFPTNIRFGSGVIQELGGHLRERQLCRPLIVTDPNLAELPLIENIRHLLQSEACATELFCEIDKNPKKNNVTKGVRCYQDSHCDVIIGIGGGASMDVSRAIALKVNHPQDLFDFDDAQGGERYIVNDIPYLICVPTTSGTGSEVGRSAVISDDYTHAKKILYSPRLMAKQVFADPELTLDLPPFITATTGMDAFTHNLEAYLAKGFHPLCDGIALEAMRLINEALVVAVQKPDLESRTKMMVAALMGAVAFQKGLGVVHSTAHALSTFKDIHHGLANALMLPACLAFNADTVPIRLKTVAQVLQLRVQSADGVIKRVMDLNKAIHIPNSLASQGIEEKDITQLSNLAYQDVCHQCNPKSVTLADFQHIFKHAL